jgi:nucleoside-diphosphate-sugar epimerase
MTVYGPGRDQGLTSDPTKAILAAVLGRRYRIGFGGRMVFQYAEDVARTMIAASRSGLRGAHVFNIGGRLASIADFVASIEAAVPGSHGLIDFAGQSLPFPEAIDDAGIEALGDVPVTPLGEAIGRTVAVFRDRLARSELVPEAHGLEASVAAT